MPTHCPTCNTVLTDDMETCPNCGQEFCPECLTPLATNAAACPTCGAEFDLFCPECDAPLKEFDAVCLACGYVFAPQKTQIVSELEINAVTAHEVEAEEAIEAEPFTGVCPECGTPLYLEDGYCEACGADFCSRCGKLVDEDDDI